MPIWPRPRSTRVGVTKLKAVHTDSHPARLTGTRSEAGDLQAPEDELFFALDADADETGDVQ